MAEPIKEASPVKLRLKSEQEKAFDIAYRRMFIGDDSLQ